MAYERTLNSVDLFYNMRDEDLIEVLEMGAGDSFFNQVTLDLHELNFNPISNRA